MWLLYLAEKNVRYYYYFPISKYVNISPKNLATVILRLFAYYFPRGFGLFGSERRSRRCLDMRWIDRCWQRRAGPGASSPMRRTSDTCPARASVMGGLRVIWRIRGERQIMAHPRPGTLKLPRSGDPSHVFDYSHNSSVLALNSVPLVTASQRALLINADKSQQKTRRSETSRHVWRLYWSAHCGIGCRFSNRRFQS